MRNERASSAARVRQLYEDWADSYSEMMDSEINLPLYSDTLGRLAERIADIEGSVVDTSCGPGHMLSMFHERYDSNRLLIGIDLSPNMVAAADARLGRSAHIQTGDMRDSINVEPNSSSAVLSFFALHHLDRTEIPATLREWHRILYSGGQLVIATWEGEGVIDYGDDTDDVVAFKYTKDEIAAWTKEAGFVVDRCVVEPVEGMPMNALYLEGTKL